MSSWTLSGIGSSLPLPQIVVSSIAGPFASHTHATQLNHLSLLQASGTSLVTLVLLSVTPANGFWSSAQYSCGATLCPLTLNSNTWNHLVISGNGFIFEIFNLIPLFYCDLWSLYFLFVTSIWLTLQLWALPVDSVPPIPHSLSAYHVCSLFTLFPTLTPGI